MSNRGFGGLALAVLAFSLAMAYLESAVVVYLTVALGGTVGEIFPVHPAVEAGTFALIEVGREAATMVMIAAMGWIAGRSGLERLAWSAVVFGAWDIGYYGWLYLFAAWPPSLTTTDLLFLIPVPWTGPVWSPLAVSVALVAFGLVAARRLRSGSELAIRRRHLAAGLLGGILVILSYTVDATRVLEGGLPGPYPWPLFVGGMALAVLAAAHALGSGIAQRAERI